MRGHHPNREVASNPPHTVPTGNRLEGEDRHPDREAVLISPTATPPRGLTLEEEVASP